jgi:hypothetical protein
MLKLKTIRVMRTEIYPDYDVFTISSGKDCASNQFIYKMAKELIYLIGLQQM